MAGITVNADLCTGCLNCQTVCALIHGGRHDKSASAIRVNLELFSGLNTITFCRQCKDPSCRNACPVNAVYMDQNTNAWKINYNICVECGSCVQACPFGAMFRQNKKPFKCELCDGLPACTEACKFQAITWLKNQL